MSGQNKLKIFSTSLQYILPGGEISANPAGNVVCTSQPVSSDSTVIRELFCSPAGKNWAGPITLHGIYVTQRHCVVRPDRNLAHWIFGRLTGIVL